MAMILFPKMFGIFSLPGAMNEFTHWLASLPVPYHVEGNKVYIGHLVIHWMAIRPNAHFEGEPEKGHIVLWEDSWATKQDLIKSRISSLLGKNTVLDARETKIAAISKPELDLFLQRHHLMGPTSCKHKMGLRYRGVLVAVASFNGPKTYYREQIPYRSYELVRYCSLSDVTISGGLSKLVAAFVEKYAPEDIMTYADREWSDGHVYESLGFVKTERLPPQSFWVRPGEWVRYRPVELATKFCITQGKEEEKEAEWAANGYCKIWNLGNLKFILKLK